jgi:hypothetical protein
MPLPIINTVARVAIRQTFAPEQLVNVIHLGYGPAAFADVDWPAVSGALANFYRGESGDGVGVRGFGDFIVPDCKLTDITITDLDDADHASLLFSVNLGGTSSTKDPLPLQDAIVGSLRTAVNSRRGRGRMFLGGWAITAVEATVSNTSGPPIVDPAVLTSIANAYTDLIGALADVDVVLGVVSITATPDEFNAITQVKVNNVFDIQRRRANKQVASSTLIVTA